MEMEHSKVSLGQIERGEASWSRQVDGVGENHSTI